MQRLNIPLSRNSKTTRRTRWVVWLLVILGCFVAAGALWASTLWFTRDTIYRAAPEQTVMTVRFFLSGEKGGHVASLLQRTALISNRPLTLSDLAPHINGELALFIKEDGSYSVAYRTNNTPISQTLLDAQAITSQTIGKRIVLLSEATEVLKPLPLNAKFLPGFSWPGHVWIGELVNNGESKRSFLFASNEQLTIQLPNKISAKTAFKTVPENVFAYLSTPLLSNASEKFIESFLPLMQSTLDPTSLSVFKGLLTQEGRVVLSEDARGAGFFLQTKEQDLKNPIHLGSMLQTIAALNDPKNIQITLEDQTTINEIIMSPESVSVKEITLLGSNMNRIRINGTELLAGRMENEQIVLTNREELFRAFKDGSAGGRKMCSGNIMGISLPTLLKMQTEGAIIPNAHPILLFLQGFKEVGVQTSLFSTRIHLCK